MWDVTTGANVLEPLIGHTGTISLVAISRDEQRILSGSNDFTIRVWNAVFVTEILPPLYGHRGRLYSVAFSPDGTLIFSGSSDKTVWVWDVTSGHVIFTLRGHNKRVSSVIFAADGQRILSVLKRCNHSHMGCLPWCRDPKHTSWTGV